jgi:hypothetical protein
LHKKVNLGIDWEFPRDFPLSQIAGLVESVIGCNNMPPSFNTRFARRLSARIFCLALALFALAPTASNDPGAASETDTPPSPRSLYNDGTKKLREGKLREAETSFQGAVASQDERVQPVALYNLGHVRYREGEQELTNAPNAKALEMNARRVFETGGSAIRAADAALAGEDTQKIVSAYLQGRGARRELKKAMEAVKNAMKQYGSVLMKWQRAAGDFKSAFELRPADTEARKNGDVVDRKIAELIDQQQKMLEALAAMQAQSGGLQLKELLERIPKDGKEEKQGSEPGTKGEGGKQEGGKKGAGSKDGKEPGGGGGMDLQQLLQGSMSAMQDQRSELGAKLRELRKRLPKEAEEAMKGNNGDDDEDDDEDSKDGNDGDSGKKPPKEPKPGEREAAGHEGIASVLTPEEAMRYLGLLKLDADRKLPIGVNNTDDTNPRERRGRDW